jgi:hypothetical protein
MRTSTIDFHLAMRATRLGLAVCVLSSRAAFAAPVSLICTTVPASPISRYISVDYSTNAVQTSETNDTALIADANGATAESAQITESQIAWQISTMRANGRAYAQHFVLSRLSGALSYYDDGTRHGEAWTCQVGAKPAPKF